MRVLVACEYSGRVREAFRNLGHDAWSCDLLESEDNSKFHYQTEVENVINNEWDLMICHPPLYSSGGEWCASFQGKTREWSTATSSGFCSDVTECPD